MHARSAVRGTSTPLAPRAAHNLADRSVLAPLLAPAPTGCCGSAPLLAGSACTHTPCALPLLAVQAAHAVAGADAAQSCTSGSSTGWQCPGSEHCSMSTAPAQRAPPAALGRPAGGGVQLPEPNAAPGAQDAHALHAALHAAPDPAPWCPMRPLTGGGGGGGGVGGPPESPRRDCSALRAAASCSFLVFTTSADGLNTPAGRAVASAGALSGCRASGIHGRLLRPSAASHAPSWALPRLPRAGTRLQAGRLHQHLSSAGPRCQAAGRPCPVPRLMCRTG